MWRLMTLFLLLLVGCIPVKEISITKERFEPSTRFQLMPPQVLTDAVLFSAKTKVELRMDFPETKLRYTLDGSPVSESSNLYDKPFFIEETTVLQTRAFHPDCQASETWTQSFYKTKNVFDDAKIVVKPSIDKRYPGNGVSTLTDLEKGSTQFREGNRWLAFQKDTLVFQIDFSEKTSLESIIVSTLANEIAWVFLPHKIELLEGDEVFAFIDRSEMKEPSKTGLHYIPLRFPKRELKKLTIRVLGEPLPKGHNGYGGIAWFFVDEIFTSGK